MAFVRAALAAGTTLAMALAAWLAITDWIDLGIFVLTLAVLLVAAVTLFAVLARPAELWVERQAELGLDDLIFFGHEPPTEFLLQLHVAAANVGALFLDAFTDDQGREVRPHQLPMPLQAQIARQVMRQGLDASGRPFREITVEASRPPVILDPDDVITLRFRARRGIDWSDHWTLDEITKLAASLEGQIARAKLRALFRQGRKVVRRTFEVDVQVVGQRAYVDALRRLTEDFTVRPQIERQHIILE